MSQVAGVLRRGEEAMSEEERDAWEERAAIIEFDAVVSRAEAEALAMQEFLAAWPPSRRSACA